ncbi:MAG: hypothetical protein LUD52_04610 [Opitutae bacterium]|nr:hypothetical protein [Opitutae bacterium]
MAVCCYHQHNYHHCHQPEPHHQPITSARGIVAEHAAVVEFLLLSRLKKNHDSAICLESED